MSLAMASWLDLPLLAGVATASLVGSLHCAGMCGAFVSLACGVAEDRPDRPQQRLTTYHLGRLVGYASLGALAGGAGSVVDLGTRAAGVGRVVALLGALTLLVVATFTLMPTAWRPSTVRRRRNGGLERLFRLGFGAIQGFPPVTRAGLIGSLTVLLPCGWLYAFAVAAAATTSPWKGAQVMLAFWVGTVPVLSVLGLGARELRARFGGAIKPIAGVALLALGTTTLLGSLRVSDDRITSMLTSLENDAREHQALPTESPDCPLCAEPTS